MELKPLKIHRRIKFSRFIKRQLWHRAKPYPLPGDSYLAEEEILCPICGGPALYNEVEIDHIIPLSKGGSNDMENLRLTHPACNRNKSDNIE